MEVGEYFFQTSFQNIILRVKKKPIVFIRAYFFSFDNQLLCDKKKNVFSFIIHRSNFRVRYSVVFFRFLGFRVLEEQHCSEIKNMKTI